MEAGTDNGRLVAARCGVPYAVDAGGLVVALDPTTLEALADETARLRAAR